MNDLQIRHHAHEICMSREMGLEMVWDSESHVEEMHRLYYPQIFNSNGAEPGGNQKVRIDQRSDNKGPEVLHISSASCHVNVYSCLYPFLVRFGIFACLFMTGSL